MDDHTHTVWLVTLNQLLPQYAPFFGYMNWLPEDDTAIEQTQTERHCSSMGGRAEQCSPVEPELCLLSFPWPLIWKGLETWRLKHNRHDRANQERTVQWSTAVYLSLDFLLSLLCWSTPLFILWEWKALLWVHPHSSVFREIIFPSSFAGRGAESWFWHLQNVIYRL